MPIKKLSIPNFELCRCIGRGNYGDVWLAKSISGTWCAIKVVWRTNFPDNESFEQEFSGILYYEPISRSHESLMKILYVGRDEGNQFYYYVSELADDSQSHTNTFVAESYHPATLTEIIRRHPEGLKMPQLLNLSKEILSAIDYLHSKDLIHRDIKPSNIIFINGKAKLADIGSVSFIGQKLLVGTQGYMPPEGPIAKQSDLYSIGMVIYEAFTGLNRLEFPKIPQQKQLVLGSRRLNKIICKLAHPQLKERYNNPELAIKDINKIAQGKKIKTSWERLQLMLLMMAFLLSAAILAISWGYFANNEKQEEIQNTTNLDQGWVKVSSKPQGAQVINLKTNTVLGETPLNRLLPFAQDQQVQLQFSLEGYHNITVKFIPRAQELIVLNPILVELVKLEKAQSNNISPSNNTEAINFTKDKVWKNNLGVNFIQFNEVYISQTEITNDSYNQYLIDSSQPYQKVFGLGSYPVVSITIEEARAFCQWLTQEDKKLGIIGQKEYYRLPSDIEWSALMGHKESLELTPFEREKKAQLNKKLLSTIKNYKLRDNTANLADESYYLEFPQASFISGYEDGWGNLSPVASYKADENNLHDIIGNVWEWIEDDYSPTESYPFCRGGSWKTYDPLKLTYAYRNVTEKSFKSPEIGFRIVLAQDKAQSNETNTLETP